MTHNPLHEASPMIYLLAVLRSSDKCIVASYVISKEVALEGVRECIAGNMSMLPGKRYTSQGSSQSIHYLLDVQGRVFTLVSSPKYSPRIAFAALDNLQQSFNKEFGTRTSTAQEESLSRPSQQIFRLIFERFQNPANVDKLAEVQEKIDVVKTTMKENIQQLLVNNEKLEQIEMAAEHLNNQSVDFKRGAKELSNKMWWKMWKMRLLIGGLITAVLIIIIVPIAVSSSNSK